MTQPPEATPVRARAAAGRRRDTSYPPAPPALPHPVVDSHCHLDIRDGDAWLGVGDALAAARAVGVTRLVQIGCDLPSARWSVEVASATPDVVAGVALHPNEAPRIDEQEGPAALAAAMDEVATLAAHPRVRAVGETGLDYFRTPPAGRAVQEEAFRAHIRLAHDLAKPLVIHDRDAHARVLEVLDEEGAPDIVVLHCFSGDAAFAAVCAARGYLLSFAGTVTFSNAATLREAVAVVPRDQLLVETDAPFLAPVPYRGRPNASYLIPLTLAAMAAARGETVDELARAVDATSEAAFGPW